MGVLVTDGEVLIEMVSSSVAVLALGSDTFGASEALGAGDGSLSVFSLEIGAHRPSQLDNSRVEQFLVRDAADIVFAKNVTVEHPVAVYRDGSAAPRVVPDC